jgi:LysM repeat protein
MQRKEMGDDFFSTASISHKQADDADETEVKQNTPVFISKINSKEKSKSEKYPLNSVFNINDAKVIYAEAGTSLLALANNYNVGFKKLLEFNELEQTEILTSNQLIFLQKKSKKGTKEVHIVEVNESIHDISQKEGIQLSVIMEFNGLQKGMQPAPGEKIYLKFPAPSSPRLAAAETFKTGLNM